MSQKKQKDQKILNSLDVQISSIKRLADGTKRITLDFPEMILLGDFDSFFNNLLHVTIMTEEKYEEVQKEIQMNKETLLSAKEILEND